MNLPDSSAAYAAEPPAAEITPEEFVKRAHEAYDRGLPERASWAASMATVGLMQQFLRLAREGVDYDWGPILLRDGSGQLACLCGSQVFCDYPNVNDLPLAICGTAECDALWDLSPHLAQPRRLRGGQQAAVEEPAWQVNDLVRHRNRYATPVGELVAEFVALLQRPSRPGWWEATVLRADPITGFIVGQGVTLAEGGSNNAVARFPD